MNETGRSIYKEHDFEELKTPLITVPEAREIIQKHGCMIEEKEKDEEWYCIVHFPKGTKRVQTGLVTHVVMYRITLPDGYILYQQFSRLREINLLFCTPDEE